MALRTWRSGRTSVGAVVTDPQRLRTKLAAFTEQGEVLGEIAMGTGSIFEEISGSPIVLLNALGFDQQGNVYVADTAFGGTQFEPPIEGKGGSEWSRSAPSGALDALAGGAAAAAAADGARRQPGRRRAHGARPASRLR